MTISPYDLVQDIYRNEPCARTFARDLELHLKFGYIYSSPDAFVMGRAVNRNGDPSDIVNPEFQFDLVDAWLVYLAVGDIREFFLREPYPLPWVGWERNNVLRFYDMETIRRKMLCIR
jgi:hypothetical protein